MIRAVLFDWGDTIMRVFPQYAGPMADWPEVAIIPGAAEALSELRGHYRLALVTNATDSDRGLVQRALARVGLADHFDAIYTPRELGARKPAPEFYAAVLRDLAISPAEAIMVGDDEEDDVAAAKRAGLRAIWLNPLGRGGRPGLCDAEIEEMAVLPEALAALL